jgi:tetratricopeptide (TPR) repeat protein
MKKFVLVVLTLLLVEAAVEGEPLNIGGEPESWLAVIQSAADLSRKGEYRDAVAKYEAALSTPKINATVELWSYVLSQMADAEIELGDYAAGETDAREALRLLARSNENQTSTFAAAQGVLAHGLEAEGNYGEAKSLAEKAVSLGKQTLSPLSPRLGILLTTMGLILQESGQLRPALALCKQALEIFANAGERYKIDLGTAYQNLAVVYADLGQPKRALEAITLALATWNEVLPPDHPFIVYALSTKVVAYTELKMFKSAEPIIPQMLRLGLSRFGPTHPERVILLNNAAALYIAEKKYAEAEPLLEEGVALSKRVFPSADPRTQHMLEGDAYVLAKLNRREEASIARAESQVLRAHYR